MIVYLDGKFVPEAEAVIPVSDRAFLLGDGLFETLLVHAGRPFRWPQHWQRLVQGADFLRLKLPTDETRLGDAITKLIALNQTTAGILRLTVSRGSGVRGYSPRGADHPRVVITLHPLAPTPGAAPPTYRLITSSLRVPAGDAVANFKTINKLGNVLARAEAEAAHADEALLLNTDGDITEAAAANVFAIEGDRVCTPPIAAGLLGGVTRGVVLELCRALEIPVSETRLTPERLRASNGAFLTLSTLGLVAATSLDGHPLPHSPLVATLQAAYQKLLESESAKAM